MNESILRRFASLAWWRLVPVRYLKCLKHLKLDNVCPLPKSKVKLSLEVKRISALMKSMRPGIPTEKVRRLQVL